jgi:hypothetical protein
MCSLYSLIYCKDKTFISIQQKKFHEKKKTLTFRKKFCEYKNKSYLAVHQNDIHVSGEMVLVESVNENKQSTNRGKSIYTKFFFDENDVVMYVQSNLIMADTYLCTKKDAGSRKA